MCCRGTKLLAERMREMHALQVQREKETLENIQDRFVRIKANQRRFEPNLIAAKTHSEGINHLAYVQLVGIQKLRLENIFDLYFLIRSRSI